MSSIVGPRMLVKRVGMLCFVRYFDLGIEAVRYKWNHELKLWGTWILLFLFLMRIV